MAHRRHDLWLLIRLAAQNVGRRRLRAVFLSAAVMLGVGIAFASFVAGWALRDGMATSFSRMGADLVVVPRATLVNITSSLLTVQPTDETLPADLAVRITAIPGVGKVAPQRIVPALVQGNVANLIAFDPARDRNLVALDAEHLFRPGLLHVVLRKHSYLSARACTFVTLYAPHLDRELIRKAMNGLEIDRTRVAQKSPVASF